LAAQGRLGESEKNNFFAGYGADIVVQAQCTLGWRVTVACHFPEKDRDFQQSA